MNKSINWYWKICFYSLTTKSCFYRQYSQNSVAKNRCSCHITWKRTVQIWSVYYLHSAKWRAETCNKLKYLYHLRECNEVVLLKKSFIYNWHWYLKWCKKALDTSQENVFIYFFWYETITLQISNCWVVCLEGQVFLSFSLSKTHYYYFLENFLVVVKYLVKNNLNKLLLKFYR